MKRSYSAEIICVGTELLLGDILNSDAKFIAGGLSEMGINVYYQTVVGDNPERLKSVVELAKSRADILITTGGLGPTYDDLTKEIISETFGKKLVLHEPSFKRLEERFRGYNRPMTENNVKQAYLPEGCTVLENDWGTAPGCAFEADGSHVIMLPGPPRECEPMFTFRARPYLEKMSGGIIVSRRIRVFGMGESAVEARLKEMMIAAKNPSIAPYAMPAEMYLRVTAKADDYDTAFSMTEPVVEEICGILGDVVYGVDVGSLEEKIFFVMKERGLTLALAESCTGGLIAKRLTDMPGVSEIFLGGVCAYSNPLKESMLGVSGATLKEYGAVSRETAIEMARGIRERTAADIGASVTGIAGPAGGTDDKPVGLVYCALSTADFEDCIELRTGGTRERVRNQAASSVLDLVLRRLEDRPRGE